MHGARYGAERQLRPAKLSLKRAGGGIRLVSARRICFCDVIMKKLFLPALERLKKYCSHSTKRIERAVFLVFGIVSAQLQGFSNLLLRRSLAKNQKSSLRIGHSIFLTALASLLLLSGCASHYVLILNNGERITTRGKPKLVNGIFYYQVAKGRDGQPISAGHVREVAPASMASPDPSSMFKSVSTP